MIAVDHAMNVAKQLKEDAVKAEGIGAEVGPMLYLLRDGTIWAVVPFVDDDVHGRFTRRDLAATAVYRSPVDEAVVITEMWESAGSVPDKTRTGAERRFAAGDPDTHEALSAVVVRADGTSGQRFARFHHEGRRVVWDDLKEDDEARGPLPDALRLGFAKQGEIPLLSPTELSNLLGVPLMTYKLRPPPRNEPCPCGSGRKAKHCCWGPTSHGGA